MAYRGAKLQPWFGTRPVGRACRDMASDGGSRMTELTKMNTPIDDNPYRTSRRAPGTLRRSIKKKPLTVSVRAGNLAYQSGCESEDEVAPHVNYGTGLWGPNHAPYIILPKKPGGMLHWRDRETGESVFAAKVTHPGIRGQFMFEIGADLVLHEFDTIVRPSLDRWARVTERQNRTGL